MDDPDITDLTKEITRRVKARMGEAGARAEILVPIGVSARHMHITREVLESLFGAGHELRRLRPLMQGGEFAAEETVAVVGASGKAIEGVRILGPTRSYTQVELARSDGFRLGLELPVRATADLKGSPGITVVGPRGTVVLREGAVRSTRHVHMSPADAARFGLTHGRIVKARIAGARALVLENVEVRVGERFVLDFHIDTDDANASGASTGDFAEIIA